jgi:hypothetical protein
MAFFRRLRAVDLDHRFGAGGGWICQSLGRSIKMDRPYNKETITETKELELKPRVCLMCRKSFESEWAGERVCRKCKSTETWRRG